MPCSRAIFRRTGPAFGCSTLTDEDRADGEGEAVEGAASAPAARLRLPVVQTATRKQRKHLAVITPAVPHDGANQRGPRPSPTFFFSCSLPRRHSPLSVDVGSVLVVEHVVQGRNLAVLVADDGEVEGVGTLGEGVNVLDPAVVRLDVVGREAEELDAARGKVGRREGDGRELGGADGAGRGSAKGRSGVIFCAFLLVLVLKQRGEHADDGTHV